ncbi:ATP-binding cassette domain-containing protein [Dermatophilus congolensis]|uniref:ATP-binding cassette domain-containing protein n=1 Tax=Dermatophilus congolensis TaxID=1863 RepID=UPI001AAEF836|nr:ATP-binding cassette domain-containing protein [Dermatophilus congolensis]MBO3130378.1 ATP-binding cassette domain-containing protein [Dermatophilus congolensis]MBO3130991.1 ATP-binding cassette domain-containing protein [Dermatophilus congolensis]MBO3134849.1 ATP-binding cassette domain-containing protein [Dermatophilus congolensis]MBO3137086.1 ATP-binding cassette domain-containing protein [Dermatophilus congolensis]MBO3139330.1 ATP-binding cassette domain-containing protein [Dermatophilu
MSSPNPSEAEVVKVRGAVKRYDGVPVLDGLDVTVHDGETFGILGVNGAGKTTLMESIVGGRGS